MSVTGLSRIGQWKERRRFAVAATAALLVVPLALSGAAAVPDDEHQHGDEAGHLPHSVANVDVVGSLRLTEVPGGIADVAYHKDHAYLAAFRPECGSAGVHVVDVSDPANPAKVAFIPAHENVYVGEGVHVMSVETQHFTGDILIHNNEACDASQPHVGGVSLWDVTDPTDPQPLALGVGDATPAVANTPTHQSHSAMGWADANRAYVALVDNAEAGSGDLDILDVTDPWNPVHVADVGLDDWPDAADSLAYGENANHHDMWVKKIKGHWYILLSYWDAGYILLDVDDPTNPAFVKDHDYPTPDTLTGFAISEGNGHQATWSSNNKFILATDEDFSPYRTFFEITTGPHAGEYQAGEFGWTVPMATAFPDGLAGPTVFGGSGCTEDANGNGVSDRDEVPPASSLSAEPGEAKVVVFSRGVCFFSTKVESGQLAGYDAVIIGNSHGGSGFGARPDSFICGSQGHSFTITVSALCIGHRAMHLLFDDPPAYASPEGYEAGGDLPAIGTVGERISADTVFDGWGYVRLLDADTLEEIDAYAVPEALDEAYAHGFGALTVHEVKTDPRDGVNLAYLSYYDAGFRVVEFGRDGIEEVGHFIAEGGNDFWGVYLVDMGNNKRPLVLLSDRDFGLWVFEYSGPEP